MPSKSSLQEKYAAALQKAENERNSWSGAHSLSDNNLGDIYVWGRQVRIRIMNANARAVLEALRLDPNNRKSNEFHSFFQMAQAGVPYEEIMKNSQIAKSLGEYHAEDLQDLYAAAQLDASLKKENVKILAAFYDHLQHADGRALKEAEKAALADVKKASIDDAEEGEMGRAFHILLRKPGITDPEKAEIQKLMEDKTADSRKKLFDLYCKEFLEIPDEYLDPNPMDDRWKDPRYNYYLQLGVDFPDASNQADLTQYPKQYVDQINSLSGYLRNIRFAKEHKDKMYLSDQPYPENIEKMNKEQLAQAFEEYTDSPSVRAYIAAKIDIDERAENQALRSRNMARSRKPEHVIPFGVGDLPQEHLDQMNNLNYLDYAEHPEKLPKAKNLTTLTKQLDALKGNLMNLHYHQVMQRLQLKPASDLSQMLGRCGNFAEVQAEYAKNPAMYNKNQNEEVLKAHLAEIYDAVVRDKEYQEYAGYYVQILTHAFKAPEASGKTAEFFRGKQNEKHPLLRKPEEMAEYEKKKAEARSFIEERILQKAVLGGNNLPRWAQVLLKKPGITKEEQDRIRSFNDGSKESTLALAEIYLKELKESKQELIDYSWDEYHGPKRNLHLYYGLLAFDSTSMIADVISTDYLDKEQAEVWKKKIIDFTNEVHANYARTNKLNEAMTNPLAKFLNVEKISGQDDIEYIYGLLAENGGIDHADKSAEKGIEEAAVFLQQNNEPVSNEKLKTKVSEFESAADEFTSALHEVLENQKKAKKADEEPEELEQNLSSLPEYEQWFRSLEWQLRGQKMDPAALAISCDGNQGSIRAVKAGEKDFRNFMNVDEETKKNLYHLASTTGISFLNADDENVRTVRIDAQTKKTVFTKNKKFLGRSEKLPHVDHPVQKPLTSEKQKEYHDELVRLAAELHKTDSRYSKDSPAYRNLRTELAYCIETSGPQEIAERIEAIAQYCKQYMKDHWKTTGLSDRQVSRLKVMQRLMDLNSFCKGETLKNPERRDQLTETQQKIALKLIQAKTRFMYEHPNQALRMKHSGKVDDYIRGCCMDHAYAWKQAEELAKTNSFHTLIHNPRYSQEQLLRMDGEKVLRKYMHLVQLEKEMSPNYEKRQQALSTYAENHKTAEEKGGKIR